MSTLDGIELFDEGGLPTCGAAFVLSSRPKVSKDICLNDWKVSVKDGSKYIVAKCCNASFDYTQSRNGAFDAAQKGLDLISIARLGDMEICNAETEHIAWWHEIDGQILRTVNIVTDDITPHIQIKTKDQVGQPTVTPPSKPSNWHECLRYFRLSQTTEDLFDSYRNLYLAIESILDKMTPQKLKASGKPQEGEGEWFKRALTEAHAKVNISPFAPKGSTNPVEDLFNELYASTRTAIFHAKSSRPSLLPHASGKGMETVSNVVQRLGNLFIRLAKSELGTHSSSNMLFAGGFDLLTQHLKSNISLHATDSPDILNTTGQVIDLDSSHAPELETRFVRSFFGKVDGKQMEKLSLLAGLFSRWKGQLYTGGIIEGLLIVRGIVRFECQMSVRGQNCCLPRAYFTS